MEHLGSAGGLLPEPARKKLPLAQRLPSKPVHEFNFYFLIFSIFQKTENLFLMIRHFVTHLFFLNAPLLAFSFFSPVFFTFFN